MATKDTGGQQRGRRDDTEDVAAEVQESSDLKERKEKLDDDIDDILAEIDETLEENAEEFVRSFVQKGGQ